VNDWIKASTPTSNGYPKELHEKAFAAGIQGVLYPKEWGGTRPDDFDAFHELVMWDELSRLGGGGVLGQMSINSMALPPIMHHGSEYVKKLVCNDVITGKKNISLMISEPSAGSDVANIKCTAVRDGDHYILNGQKKWITGGLMADFFTCACRTGGEGMGGISLVLLERNMPGITVRKMETQFDNSHNTTFVILEDVKVPVRNLIGKENQGFKYLMHNFNHERFLIAIGTCRSARMCYQESIKEAMSRKTFGKRLVEHQIIRYKLAEMARQIESLYDSLERVAYSFSEGVPDTQLGGQCALLKVQASKTFEYCAREAVQIFGGSGIVKEGRGMLVERLYREVRGVAIPGGSEEILLDFAIRQALSKSMGSKL
jgi:alkylation response protein AidB-like acyl-CoA dehydrogenase